MAWGWNHLETSSCTCLGTWAEVTQRLGPAGTANWSACLPVASLCGSSQPGGLGIVGLLAWWLKASRGSVPAN